MIAALPTTNVIKTKVIVTRMISASDLESAEQITVRGAMETIVAPSLPQPKVAPFVVLASTRLGASLTPTAV